MYTLSIQCKFHLLLNSRSHGETGRAYHPFFTRFTLKQRARAALAPIILFAARAPSRSLYALDSARGWVFSGEPTVAAPCAAIGAAIWSRQLRYMCCAVDFSHAHARCFSLRRCLTRGARFFKSGAVVRGQEPLQIAIIHRTRETRREFICAQRE